MAGFTRRPVVRRDTDLKQLEDTLHAVLPNLSHEAKIQSGRDVETDVDRSSARTSRSFEPSGPATPVPGEFPNFAQVHPGLYRSSFPHIYNYEYLTSLNLRTIVTLVSTVEPHYEPFMEARGIKHYRIELPAHKEDGVWIPSDSMRQVLSILQEEANYPLLVHCNKGKHRTGCAIACYRMLNGWSKDDVIEEYRRYAAEKARALDEKFIREIASLDDIRPVLAKDSLAVQTDGPSRGPYPTPPSSDKSINFSC